MMRWNDKQGHRGRGAWLLLVDGQGAVHVFAGDTIPGVVAVLGADYAKAGKWSARYYRLQLAPGVRAIAGRDGWETGRFVEGLRDAVNWPAPIDRWVDVANALGVMLSEAERFLREWRPAAAEALDQVERDLETVDTDAGDDGAETVAVSFGHPTNRQMDRGFWRWPVRVLDAEGHEVGHVAAHQGCWDDPQQRPTATGQVRVLALECARGYHGGTVSLRLAVPAGCRAVHEPEEE